MDTNFEIFRGKSFKDLCKDIYNNHVQKKAQIEKLIDDLRKMFVKPDDAPLIIPFIKDYLQAANVNDEHLIRLASIIQKLIIAEEEAKIQSGGLGITEEERKKIMDEIGNEMDSIVKSSDEALMNVFDKK